MTIESYILNLIDSGWGNSEIIRELEIRLRISKADAAAILNRYLNQIEK